MCVWSEDVLCCCGPVVARIEQRSAYYPLSISLGKTFSLSDPSGFFLSFLSVLHNGNWNILDISSSSVLAPPKENVDQVSSLQDTQKVEQRVRFRDEGTVEWYQVMFTSQNGHIGCWVTGTAVCGTPGTATHNKVKVFLSIQFELGEMLKTYKQELVLLRR